jgi:DNA-binding transcriptional regulator YdaS (Cro superfamily)
MLDMKPLTLHEYLSRPESESMSAFARRLGVNPDQVRQWRNRTEGRQPSAENSAAIEKATEGLVTCETLRPDLAWHRIKDKAWPWHRAGRPALDVTAEAVGVTA